MGAKTLMILRRVELVCFWVAAALTLVVAVLTTYAALRRYLAGAPMTFPFEFAGYALVYATMLSLAYIGRQDGHVRVDLLSTVLGPKFKLWTDRFAALVTTAVAAALCYASVDAVIEAIALGLTVPSVLAPPAWVLLGAMPIGFGLLALQQATCIFQLPPVQPTATKHMEGI